MTCEIRVANLRSRNREAARFFNVDESNIHLWRRNKTENCDRRKRADRRGKPHWPELEAEINKWILKERDDGKAVSTVSIRMKARVIARNGRSTVGQKLPDDWEKQLDDFFDILQANYC
ncbi:uncharacterized protein TNCV_3174771 [Trichonephila clavipes]|nr:uncharacterized protein TNCV_3174771 [Trichonephila clavipes]